MIGEQFQRRTGRRPTDLSRIPRLLAVDGVGPAELPRLRLLQLTLDDDAGNEKNDEEPNEDVECDRCALSVEENRPQLNS